jgi:hypothetical protein
MSKHTGINTYRKEQETKKKRKKKKRKEEKQQCRISPKVENLLSPCRWALLILPV